MNNTNWPLLLTATTIVFGGVTIFGAIQLLSLARLLKHGVMVTGEISKVTRYREQGIRNSENRSDLYSVSVRYLINDHEYNIDIPLDTNPPFYTQGKSVPVYYYRDRPERGRVVCAREFVKWLILTLAPFTTVAALFFIWIRVT